MSLAWHVARMGESRVVYRWGNLRERDHLRGPRRRWDDNIKMDLQEVGCEGMEWSGLVWLIGKGGGHLRMR